MSDNKDKIEVLYRYVSEVDYQDGLGAIYQLRLKEHKVFRETKGCYVIRFFDLPGGKEKFILKNSRKRFAYPTKQEALDNYIARTVIYKTILDDKLEMVSACLEYAKHLDGKL